MTWYHTQKTLKKPPENYSSSSMISEKFAEYKINIPKSIASLYTDNKILEIKGSNLIYRQIKKNKTPEKKTTSKG